MLVFVFHSFRIILSLLFKIDEVFFLKVRVRGEQHDDTLQGMRQCCS